MSRLDNTRHIFNKYAKDYREKYLDQSAYAAMLDHFLEAVPMSGRVLDLGCGPGNICRYLLDRRPDLLLRGLDLAPAMVEEAGRLNPEAEFRCVNVMDDSFTEKGLYNGVVSGFLLPYLSADEVVQHLNRVKELLAPEGICYLSFLELASEGSKEELTENSQGDKLLMNFYETRIVERMASEAGFVTEKMEKRTPRGASGESTNIEIIMILRSS